MPITSTNYPDMTAALKIQWLDAFESDTELETVKQIYQVEKADGLTGYITSLDSYSPARLKEESDDLPYLSLTQNYRKSWTTRTLGGMDKISWEMRLGDRYGEITNRIRNIAKSSAKRMMYDLTHRLTYAASTAYTDADGVSISTTTGDDLALCYTAHTVNGSSTTYRNIVSGNPVLSKTGLEAAETLFFTQMIDENGMPQPVMPTHLVIGGDANTINTAMEYLKSTASPTVSNSGVFNVYQGKYQLIILKYLAMIVSGSGYAYSSTYSKYWFLVDNNNKKGILKTLLEPQMVAPNSPESHDFETQDWKYGSAGMYAIVWLDGKNIVMSKGDGS